jgi:hypothetical protein
MVEATDDTPASMDKLGIQIPEHSSTASFGTTSEATIRTDVGIDRKIPYDDLLWSNYQKATSGLGFTPMNTPVHIPTSTLGLTTVQPRGSRFARYIVNERPRLHEQFLPGQHDGLYAWSGNHMHGR